MTRLIVWGRTRSLDFDRLLGYLPARGTLVDLGCGHGLACFLAHLRYPELQILGRDLNASKIEVAERVRPPDAPIHFEVGGGVPQTPASINAVAMLDVLPYVPFEGWEPLFREVHHCLASGGVFLIKTHDPSMQLKFLWNRLHETLSTWLNSVERWSDLSFRSREWFIDHLGAIGFEVRVERMDRGTPYSHILYVARKPEAN